MLELREYPIAELEAIMKSTGKQALDRKLERQFINFTSTGRGRNRVYAIKEIPDPFKVYAITKLGIPAQARFDKIRNLYFYLFCSEGFAELPLIEMERVMASEGVLMARQTITKWINYLQHIDYISFSGEFKYYAIEKLLSGHRKHKEIDKETYNKGWTIYFQKKEEIGCGNAYSLMYNILGGHPYKKAIIVENAILQSEIDELISVINDSFLDAPM